MRFGILGPLLVHDGGAAVEVPAARQRALLAALLVHTGQAVPTDSLAEMVWDESPPAEAAATLRTYVMRLRRALGSGAGARVMTRYPGYLLEAGTDEVDLLKFDRLCGRGGAAVRAGDWRTASAALGEALGLWRGAALVDIPSQTLQRGEVPRLVQARLQALEWQADARLNLGEHAELVAELQSLAAEHPLRECFHAQLMLALYRSGRQAEALAVYREARQILVAELGTEPGRELRELHQRILTGDPTLAVPGAGLAALVKPEPTIPRELPASVMHFVGRSQEMAALTGLLDQICDEPSDAVLISAVGGTAGVGKTALAVRWAHQAADRFPDGQLYVNLRGYDRDQRVTAAAALAGFLKALGVSGQDVPAEETERAARYRSLLAGRRLLVVLDNAGSVDQVRPLLPGTRSCMAIVTSRDSLPGLVARDGARRLDLDLLPLDEAIGLLRALIGGRVDGDPDAAAALAAQCSRLPLALRVAADFAVTHPAVPLADLVTELAIQHRTLDLLDAGGDSRTGVRAVFSWSYRHLDPGTALAFRLMALHPGPDVDPYAAAALTNTAVEQARCHLELLARAHLLTATALGRYVMHDLLRVYALDLACAYDTEEQRHAALTRLFDYYLHTAAVAMDTLFAAERHLQPGMGSPDALTPPVSAPDTARRWLDAERTSLVAVAAHSAACGWPGHATRLAATLDRYLGNGCHFAEAIAIHRSARDAARHTRDHAAEAVALISLGYISWEQCHYQQAFAFFQQALAESREASDRDAEADALSALGLTEQSLGLYEQAAGHIRAAVALYREVSDRLGEAQALSRLGNAFRRQGRYEPATNCYCQALAMFREVGDRGGEGYAHFRLGVAELEQGRHQQAADHLRQAVPLFCETGDRLGEAETLAELGFAELRQNFHQQATSQFQRALALFREAGVRSGEAKALSGLGEILLLAGLPGRAIAHYRAALDLASQIGGSEEQARSYAGLARAHHLTGYSGQARRYWREALSVYAELGSPEAGKIRAQMITAGYHDHP